MKLKKSVTLAKLEGHNSRQQMSIDVTGKIYEILTTGLYSNPVLAVVRELSTNAYDSHVDNGNPDEPFHVHLPSWSDPNFWIRDFGVGMSRDMIERIYSVYGCSTKDDSNEFTGCLGIGKVVGLAYNTKSFTLESWCDGMHYIYNVFWGDEGIPEISLTSANESNEPTGVKVTVPAAKNDFENFKREALLLFKYFDTPPKIVGTDDQVREVKYVMHGATWGLRQIAVSFKAMGPRAIMGNICYPIQYVDSNLQGDKAQLLRMPLDLYFDLGDLNFEASRESLRYDPQTKSMLLSKLDVVINDLTAKVSGELENCESLWEARVKMVQLYDSLNAISTLRDTLNNIKWKNQNIFPTNVRGRIPLSVPVRTFTPYRKNGITTTLFDMSTNSLFFEDDLKVGGIVRAKSLVTHDTWVYLIAPDKVDTVVKELGFKDDAIVKKISTIESPNARKSSGPKVKKKGVSVLKYKIPQYQTYFQNRHWDDLPDFDLSQGGIYVPVHRHAYLDSDGKQKHPKQIQQALRELSRMNITSPTIYGLRANSVKKIAKSQNWQLFWDWLKETMEKAVSSTDFDYAIKLLRQLDDVSDSMSKHNVNLHFISQFCKSLPSDHLLNQFVVSHKSATESAGKIKAEELRNLVQTSSKIKYTTTKKQIPQLHSLFEQLIKTYPLLTVIDKYRWENHKNVVINYLHGE